MNVEVSTSQGDLLRGNFHGCYLLVSKSESSYYKGRTYVGYTVDPNRRIKQHNGGRMKGGAKKTSDRGPWDMVLVVYGFPCQVAALRFEWAWQNPEKSRRLKTLGLKKVPRKESQFQFRFRIMNNMLNTPPWSNLKLSLQWLKPEYRCDFPVELRPNCLGSIGEGIIQFDGVANPSQASHSYQQFTCFLCDSPISKDDFARCPVGKECQTTFHLVCIGTHCHDSNSTQLIPFNGQCPKCDQSFHWMDLFRKYRIDQL